MATPIKRRRTTNDSPHINNIPDALLTHISIYLAKPSQALFAIALTHQSDNNNNNSCKAKSDAIISATSREEWQELDFGDIEKSLAAKLLDGDVQAIFSCIGAPNNLKVLKLAGCINIVGSGLNIVRNTAIEHIDLSLVGTHESPVLDPEPQLSESTVIPILDSIITNRRSLKLLELPWKLRNDQSPEMMQFLEQYERYLRSIRYRCSKCDDVCHEIGVEERWIAVTDDTHERFYGTQNYTCSVCLNYFCDDEECSNGDEHLFYCSKCVRGYCNDCISGWIRCLTCAKSFCIGCDPLKVCYNCERLHSCNECISLGCCAVLLQCSRNECNKVICDECIGSGGKGVGKCDSCRKGYCSSECQYLECREDWKQCSTCTERTAVYLDSKCQQQKKMIEQLCSVMGDL